MYLPEKSETAVSLRRVLGMIAVYGVQLAFILLLFPYIGIMAFVITFFPGLVGGWLLGRWGGMASGMAASSITMSLRYLVDGLPESSFCQAVFGVVLTSLVGFSVGFLREIVLRSQLALQRQHEAERKQRKLEKQLQQTQKMEAIGTLAGGVAHDINNILGIVMSSASVLSHNLKREEREEKDSSDVDNILTACRRGRDLTRNLLGFARKGTYVKSVLDLNATVESAVGLLRPVISKNIQIHTRLSENLHPVYGDGSQIEQAILNICINASEAIENKGAIVISSRNSNDADAPLIEAAGSGRGSFAVIEIEDDGSGIDIDTLRHVFEPFFTTKKPGHGTGLGLSMAYGTMKKHGGSIDIESRVGEGTRLTLMLPAHREAKNETVEPIPVTSTKANGSILLVDDEPLIRTSNQRLLRQLGYEVLLAENGERALELYQSAEDRIVLVILDVIMPGMDGRETFGRLREMDPGVRVLISSGYSKDENIDTLLNEGAIGFIQKPFDLQQIEEILSQLSD